MMTDTLAVFARARSSAGTWLGWACLWIVAVLCFADAARAQLGAGALVGRVVDVATQQPLEDVAITARSPAAQREQVVLTDGAGAFRDPDLNPQSSCELSLGGEYEIFGNARVGVTYLRRWMNDVIEDLSRDEGSTFFLGNPGRGIASDFPQAKRTYDAAILSLTKTFSDLWLAQASYTLAHLRGNWEGLYRPQTGQLDPGSNSDFDLRSLTVNRYGPLAGDRRHELKLFLARDVPINNQHRLNLGGSYRARSGGPRSHLGSHVLYGLDEVFILPRGSGERLPWMHTIDAHLGYTLLQTEARTLSFALDAFNLFDFAAVVARSQRYTTRDVEPITGSAADSPFVNGDRRQIDPARITPADGDERPFDETDRFRAYGAPTAYQDPLTVRLSVKATF